MKCTVSNSVKELPRLIQGVLDDRQCIREQLQKSEAAGQKLRNNLHSLTADSDTTLEFACPVNGSLPSGLSAAVTDLQDALASLAIERDRCKKSNQAHAEMLASIRTRTNRLAVATATVDQLKSCGLGIHFLQKIFVSNYDTKLSSCREEETRQQQALAMSRNRLKLVEAELKEVEASFRTAKAAALQAVDRQTQATAEHFALLLDESAKAWTSILNELPPFFRCDWTENSWRGYELTSNYRSPFWVAGMVEEQANNGHKAIAVPYLAPLLGSKRTVIIKGDLASSQSLMQGLVLHLATMLPYGATFTLLDPSGAGRAFPMQRGLPFLRPIGAEVARDLDTLLEDIGRIIRTYLDAETDSFEVLPEEIQANERYEFIFAANFPEGYDRRSIESLQRIAKNGTVAGKYLFIQASPKEDLPRDLEWADFGELFTLNVDKIPLLNGMEQGRVKLLRAAEGSCQRLVLDRLASAKPPETNIRWAATAEQDPTMWWKEDACMAVSAPVGASGRDRLLNIWFGINREGRPCAHGILGAMSGSGKSNLYHTLVCGLAVRYGPEELNFYLIDGKMGVEFQPYRVLPHARVVALHTAPELSRSVLAELIAEMERRNETFGRLGVVDLPGYRNIGSPHGPMPRIILMVDEYQELFEDDRQNQASSHLLTLAQQGRSVGIHLLLGSQRFGAAGMLNQAAVFGSMHLRIAMQMTQADVQGLVEFGRNGRRLVEQCDLPGKIVINSNSGDDNSNEFGKVAWMDVSERSAVLSALVVKAQQEWPAERRFATVVFDGREQPHFAENPQIMDLIRLPGRPSSTAWQRIAKAPVHQQGFGVLDWYAGERPAALWLGQELNVHGQARIILRRRPMENLLIVGENLEASYGILSGVLLSLIVNEAPEGVGLWVVDRALPGTPWAGTVDLIENKAFNPLGYKIKSTRESKEAMSWLEEWRAELDRRSSLEEQELRRQPIWMLALMGCDRLPTLTREVSNYGAALDSADGEKLRYLYTKGPVFGLHILLTFTSVGTLKQCMDRAQLEQFKHRIVTQMGEADSFLLIGNDHASKLQRGESRPVFAICHDHSSGLATKFKPYTIEAQMPWVEQLRVLVENLERWKEGKYVDG